MHLMHMRDRYSAEKQMSGHEQDKDQTHDSTSLSRPTCPGKLSCGAAANRRQRSQRPVGHVQQLVMMNADRRVGTAYANSMPEFTPPRLRSLVVGSLSNAFATSSKTGEKLFPSKSKAEIVVGRGRGDEFDADGVAGASLLVIVATAAAGVSIV